jgi:surface protein
MSGLKYGSGRNQFVGQSIIYPVPIPLDPAQYKGACIVAEDDEFYYSNGSEWVIPQEDVDISRPSARVPTNAEEQTQLRLSNFRSLSGVTQEGIQFEINLDGVNDFTAGANTTTRTVVSATENKYQILYPDDGFEPGDVIWWRAFYIGSEGTQSEYSFPFSQTFPDIITTPTPITRPNQITGQVEVTPFESPSIFGLSYYETEVEFYAEDEVTLLYTMTDIGNGVTAVPDVPELLEGATYSFRMRHGGRVSIGAPVFYSGWSTVRSFFNGGGALLLEYNLDNTLNRTVNLPLGVYDATGINVVVNWGDGSEPQVFTSGGVRSRTYAPDAGPIVNVSISGSLRQFGGNTNIQGLKRVDNWGFKLGLTSLREALRNVQGTLEYVSPDLPTTVTSMQGMFQSAALSNPSLSIENLSTQYVSNMVNCFFAANTGKSVAGWDTSSVTTMESMFGSSNFNHPSVALLDTSSVTNMLGMFANNKSFNQNINNWDVSSVVNMSSMFNNASAFDQPLNNWNTSSVTDMSFMFAGSDRGPMAFNKDLGNWDVSKVTTMRSMFGCEARVGNGTNNSNSIVFNNGGSPSINNWDTSSVTNMSNMFAGCRFNQPIGDWDVSNVTDMSFMFSAGRFNTDPSLCFNQNIGNWDVSKVTTMRAMFAAYHADHFFNNGGSPSIDNWDTSSLVDVSAMFNATWEGGGREARHYFNQPIGNWNTSKVTNMAAMFLQQSVNPLTGQRHPFNQPIGDWDVSSVASMDSMFNLGAFNQDISAWDLRNDGVDINPFFVSIDNEFYSKMLTGWAIKVHEQDAPRAQTLAVSGRTYSNTDFSSDFPGKRFANAVDARAFLVGARSVSVSGASNATADGTYLWSATTLRYTNSVTNWYFIRIGNRWELRDGSNVVQDTSNALNQNEPYKETWQGMLAAATLLLAGAGWTITGDSLV